MRSEYLPQTEVPAGGAAMGPGERVAPTARTPSPVPPPPPPDISDKGAELDIPDKDTEPARYLAWELYCFVSGRPEVEVPHRWEEWWTKDFEQALRQGYSYDDLWLAIRASQTGKARPMYVRAAGIMKQLDLLIENGRKLERGGFLDVMACPYCHTNFTEIHYFKHVFEECPDQPEINPADALEEQLMDMSEEMHGEGFGRYAEDASMFWPERDDGTEGHEMFFPEPDDSEEEHETES